MEFLQIKQKEIEEKLKEQSDVMQKKHEEDLKNIRLQIEDQNIFQNFSNPLDDGSNERGGTFDKSNKINFDLLGFDDE